MAAFTVRRRTPLTTAEVWRRLTDWPAHARRVPLTRVTGVTPGPAAGTVGVGTRFTVRTGVGRFGFDDPMEVVRWEPPGPGAAATGSYRLEKRGRVITGWAEITVDGTTPAGARVVWTEDLRIRGFPRVLDPVVRGTGRVVFGRALSGLLSSPASDGTGGDGGDRGDSAGGR
ncbi:SRPBCC family protein [Streptomyces sp. SP18CS02]|uniref:SRPBCC family protein n=1 Tax=Streptomyces sp. SP18CS02 TaxID=3002531 RepID=UPI002E765B6E|nr:SRPBCC family protein [Streptomyces sp. SP18CS02]MEE1755320.1 SRPBCC family protein [Streptomyces sp. SP18CS02]